MILGIEIALTVMGLYLVITGRTYGKNIYSHPMLRWLGGFCLLVLPVALVATVAVGIVIAFRSPSLSPEQLTEKVRVPGLITEGAIALSFALVAVLWERAIKRRAVAA